MSLRNVILSDVEDVFLNVNEFAETVTFHCPSGPVELTAIVDINDGATDDTGETPTTYTGQVSISAVDVPKLERDRDYPLTITVRENKWHVVDSGQVEHGMRVFSIRRQERKLSNAVTLDGRQKRYGKLSPQP